MAEKRQFFKEEVSAYSELFHQTRIGQKGKERVPIQACAKLLDEQTMIEFEDQVLIMLKSYG